MVNRVSLRIIYETEAGIGPCYIHLSIIVVASITVASAYCGEREIRRAKTTELTIFSMATLTSASRPFRSLLYLPHDKDCIIMQAGMQTCHMRSHDANVSSAHRLKFEELFGPGGVAKAPKERIRFLRSWHPRRPVSPTAMTRNRRRGPGERRYSTFNWSAVAWPALTSRPAMMG